MAPASDWPGSELIHQRMAVVRGVESGFSLARAARGGVVSANDSRGREIAARQPVKGEDTVVTATLPIGTGNTLYARTDDWFARVCVILTILLMLRLGVTLLSASIERKRGAARSVKPSGVVSVDLTPAGTDQEQVYRPPVRPDSQG